MKKGTFEKDIFIEADGKRILDVLVSFSEHTKIHPLIIGVETGADPSLGVKRYFITDQLKWGPFRFKIRYQTDVVDVTENSVHFEAYQSPGTYITNVTTVIPEGNGVRFKEVVTLKAPNLLFGYAFSQADAAHTEMLIRIKDFFEAEKA